LLSAKVPTGYAVVVAVRDLVDAVTHLVHRDIACLAKKNLVVWGYFAVVTNVANSVHVLLKLLLPRQIQLLLPFQLTLMQFEGISVSLPFLCLALVRDAFLYGTSHELVGLPV
jgi:hypothetical protein